MAQVLVGWDCYIPNSAPIRPEPNAKKPAIGYAQGWVFLTSLSGTGGYFPYGAGWVAWYEVSEKIPRYNTTTDKCLPPDSVTLDVITRTLTITGGAGGDLNTFEGWGVSWRETPEGTEEWGEWSEDDFTAVATVTVQANEGMVRVFRARTHGSAGEEYYSDYVECPTLLYGVTAVTAPQGIWAIDPNPVATESNDTEIVLTYRGAAPGISNPISSFELYLQNQETQEYEFYQTVNLQTESGEFSAGLFNLSVGEVLRFKMKTIGTTAGYDSPLSDATAVVTGSYGKVKAPTTVIVSSPTTYPSGFVKLSWENAEPTYENVITGYNIYRSNTPDGGYVLVKSKASSLPNDSVILPVSPVNGEIYYFKVQTVGSQKGFDSVQSTAYASVKAVAYVAPNHIAGRTNSVV